MSRLWRVGLYALLACGLGAPVAAQPTQKLYSVNKSGTITANGGSVELLNTGGLGALKVQSTDTYSGTWELQCSVAPAGEAPVYDTDDELNLSLEGSTSAPVQEVTDTEGIWTASIAGCTAVKVITTAWTSGSLTIYMYATTAGGGGGGGGGASGSVEVAEGGATAQVTATSGGSLQVECAAGCGGSGGTSAVDDADFTDSTSEFTLGGGVAEQAAPSSVTEGDMGAFAMTLNRALKTSLYNASGTAAFGTAGTAATPVLTVQGIASMTPIQVTNTTVASASAYLTARLTDGSSFLTPAVGLTVGSAFGTAAPGALFSYKDFDGSALPTTTNVNTEEEATPAAASIVGVQYVMVTTENGAATPVGVDDAAATTAGAAVIIGARADDTSTDSVDEDDIGYLRMSLNRLLYTRTIDPCSGVAKTYLPIDIVTATTTEITPSLAGASTHYYICSVALVTAGANNVAIVDDDSDGCGSVTSGVMGGFGSAAEGFNLAANGGLTFGNGESSIARTNGTNRVLCIITSAAVQLSGTITVVAAP